MHEEDDETLVVIENAGAAYGKFEFARDFQGSIQALIDRSNNTVVERYRYSPFGAVSIEDGAGTPLTSSAYGNERFFMGRLFDAEIDAYDVRNRWEEPDTGTFLSPDPLLAVDAWNMYQYGYGLPATWMDPFGLEQEPVDQEPAGSGTAAADTPKPPPTAAEVKVEFTTVEGMRYGVIGGTVKAFPQSQGERVWWSNGEKVNAEIAKKVLAATRANGQAAWNLMVALGRYVFTAGTALVVCTVIMYVEGVEAFLDAADAADAADQDDVNGHKRKTPAKREKHEESIRRKKKDHNWKEKGDKRRKRYRIPKKKWQSLFDRLLSDHFD